MYDIIVIGGGISGLSAGIYSARAGKKTLILEGTLMSSVDYPGGQLMLTESIENYPGFTSGSGEDLIDIAREQALSAGAKIIEQRATSIDLDEVDASFREVTTNEGSYFARKVIIATGAIAKRIGVPGEDELYGHGVSSCATCDGAFFKNQEVAVIGGGETAVEDALYMASIASQVYLVHRRDKLKANSPASRAVMSHPKVSAVMNVQVKEVLSEEGKVSGVSVVDNISGDERVLPVHAMFVAVGHDPQSELVKNSAIIEVKNSGYIVADGVRTNAKGIFVSGDVADDKYRQAITAAASGAQAAMDAVRELDEES